MSPLIKKKRNGVALYKLESEKNKDGKRGKEKERNVYIMRHRPRDSQSWFQLVLVCRS